MRIRNFFLILFQILLIMNKLRDFNFFVVFFLTVFSQSNSFSQTTVVPNKSQEVIDQLMDRKMKQNNQFSLYTNYSIQLKNGDKDEVERMYKEFIAQYPDVDATIIFSNPKFKLIVGNFKHKIEAEHLLRAIQHQYSGAFVVKLGGS